MAVTYGFFNSVNGDRKYNADQMSEYFRGIVSQGVFQHLDSGMAVSAGTGLSVSVAAGRAIIQDRWIQNSAALNLTISAASETYGRKDAVVIRLDKSSRAISITVKTGTPAASPVAPSMTRNATTYEMALAYVNVAAGASSVTVTDKRSDSSVCGWASVAQATSGEVDQMLNDMKTGFDGVVYSSPAEMVIGEDDRIQSQLDGIEYISYGFEVGSSATDAEKRAIRLFLDFYTEGDVDFSNYRLTAVTNSNDYPHTIHFRYGNDLIAPVYDSSTGYNIAELPGGKVICKVDWGAITGHSLNISYNDAHISPTANGKMTFLNSANLESETVSEHDKVFNKSIELIKGEAKTASSTIEQRYIENNGTVGTYANTNILLYAVEKGKRYTIDGVAKMQSFPVVAFTTNPSLKKYTPLVTNDQGVNDFFHVSMIYQAKVDGYLAIVEYIPSTEADYVLSVYDFDFKYSLKYGYMDSDIKNSLTPVKSSTVLDSIGLEGRYINESLKLATISNTGFKVKLYPVEAGQTVVLYGSARLEAAYPIACFAGQSSHDGEIEIIGDDTATTMTDYNVPFTAPSAGFVNVAYSTVNPGRGEVICYDPVYASSDGAVPKLDIKLEAFGDSITDNYHNTWSGHTTWLNHIENVTERYFDLAVINGAYGGAALANHNQYSVVNRVCGGNGATSLLDTTADVIMVWGGTNDWAGNLSDIGTMDSDDTTIKGAVKKIIEYISTNTTAALVFATPMQRYNDSDAERDTNEDGEPLNTKGYTLKDICDAIQEVCDFYGVDCIRMDKMAGFNRINIRSYAGDGLHPSTAKANRRVASIFGEEFRRFLMN